MHLRKTTTREAKSPKEPAPDPCANWLHLRSVSAVVPPGLALDRPLVMALVVEDACWEFGQLALAASRPRWWQFSACRNWRRDRRRLEDKRERLLETAQ
jgi:hypothetical protein